MTRNSAWDAVRTIIACCFLVNATPAFAGEQPNVVLIICDDPHGWTNLADDPSRAEKLAAFQSELKSRVPAPGSSVPPQPPLVPNN